jgi:hypothetical protein
MTMRGLWEIGAGALRRPPRPATLALPVVRSRA